jgi:hypothetical protein
MTAGLLLVAGAGDAVAGAAGGVAGLSACAHTAKALARVNVRKKSTINR